MINIRSSKLELCQLKFYTKQMIIKLTNLIISEKLTNPESVRPESVREFHF